MNLKRYKSTIIALISTFLILFIFQGGSYITAPGIKVTNTDMSSIAQMLNLFGGGGLKKASLFAIGISPYITAQIIIQILSNDVIKHFAEMRQMGEAGRYKLELYTRLLTLPFAILTALSTLHILSAGQSVQFLDIYNNLATVSSFSALWFTQKMMLVVMFVAGTYITLFLSDIISKRGVGNGITLIIMSGIIASLPENFSTAFTFFNTSNDVEWIYWLKFISYCLVYLLVLGVIIYINGSVKKIYVQQSGQGLITQKNNLSYMPIKLMPAGIIPVVFAGSLMMLPTALAEMTIKYWPNLGAFVLKYLSFASPTGLLIYFFLIIAFSFLYSHMQINVEEISRNFQKEFKFIPSIRPGQITFNYIKQILNLMNCLGAPFLALVSILPNILTLSLNMPTNIALGGTGVIIMVSGALQIHEEIKAIFITSKYDSSINRLW